jgi:hypothetical protein
MTSSDRYPDVEKMKTLFALIVSLVFVATVSFAGSTAGPIRTPEAKALLAKGLSIDEAAIEFFKLSGWYARYDKIGHYDKSLYDLADPGIAPDGVVVLTRDKFYFAVWDKEKKSYRSFFDFPISDVAEAKLLERDLVVTIKRISGHFHVLQLGGSRVDKDGNREVVKRLNPKKEPNPEGRVPR